MAALKIGGIVLLASVYFYLSVTIGSLMTWVDVPGWWYPVFGSNSWSAIAWLQLTHSLGVIIGALPIAFFVVLKYEKRWVSTSIIIGALGTLSVLYLSFDGLRHAFLRPDPSAASVTSSVIDLSKYFLIPLLLVALVRKVLRSNDALRKHA